LEQFYTTGKRGDTKIMGINFIGYGKVICSKEQWLNMDREEKLKKECKQRKNNPPKFSKLQKELINRVTLELQK
jgi:hypothetical protein